MANHADGRFELGTNEFRIALLRRGELVTAPTKAKLQLRITDHGWVFDPIAKTSILFGGGSLHGGSMDDTWIWNGSDWSEVKPKNKPGQRLGPGMAWDGVNQKVMLFGGSWNLLTYANDTYEWDRAANNWIQLSPAKSPSPRIVESLAYDEARKQVVLFGGYDGRHTFSDTWLWDGKNWTEAHPAVSPAGRFDHGTAYDSVRKEVVVFGARLSPTESARKTTPGFGTEKTGSRSSRRTRLRRELSTG